MNSLKLKAVTLNCWGVPVVARDRVARMRAIGEWLARSDFDFVFLQELWIQSDIDLVRQEAAAVYPHQHYFHSGVIGSGMCILSRHTIVSALYHRYSVNGFAHRLHHADWFGGKGVGFCRVRVAGLNVHLYITHLHANYNKSRDEYLCHRLVQSFDCAQFVRLTSESSSGDIVIYAGDFNTNASELPYKLIVHGAHLSDTYYLDARHQNHVQDLDAATCAKECGTCDTRSNSYTCRSGSEEWPNGERIDLVFVAASSDRVEITGCDYDHPLPCRVPGKTFSYSDHEAVSASLSLVVHPDEKMRVGERECDSVALSDALSEAVSVCEKYLRQLRWHKLFYTAASVVLFVLVFLSLLLPAWLGSWLHLLRFGITALCCYSMFMATVWDRIERAGVIAGIDEMRIALASSSPRSSMIDDCHYGLREDGGGSIEVLNRPLNNVDA